jgi:Spy/CpxP family protein refolding chaperone
MEDDMKGKFNFKLGALCAILGAMLLIPAPGQAKEDEGAAYKQQRAQMIKELKLTPEKEKAVLAVEDKYVGERKEIIAGVKKANEELQAAVASANPDEAKLKQLVSTLTAGQDKLFASFKSQRDEELALMTPVEQARYFQVLAQWRQKMVSKSHPKAPAVKE